MVFGFGVEYTTEYARLAEIPSLVKGIVDAREGLRFDRAHFKEYGDFALIFEVVYYVLSPDFNGYMDQQQAINLELFRAFEERGIQFAFPTQKLLLSRDAPSKRGLKSTPEAGVDTRAAGLENAARRGADGPRGYTVSD